MTALLTRFQRTEFWLVSTAAALIALHLALLSRASNPELSQELLATCLLLWSAVGFLAWERRYTLVLQSDAIASAIGGGLLLGLLFVSSSLPMSGSFLRGFPFVVVLGLGLLASGGRRLYQYWRELLVFGLLTLNPLLKFLLELINLPKLTAQAATFMLWYSGFDVHREALSLLLPAGRVDVYGPCSGIHNMLQMLSIAVLFVMMFPLRSLMQRFFCVTIAVFIGFMVNAARVALMAILVAYSQKSAFEYWHVGNGSLVFSAIAVGLFAGFCWFAFLRTPQTASDTGNSSHG